jgi:hypothetical protein
MDAPGSIIPLIPTAGAHAFFMDCHIKRTGNPPLVTKLFLIVPGGHKLRGGLVL